MGTIEEDPGHAQENGENNTTNVEKQDATKIYHFTQYFPGEAQHQGICGSGQRPEKGGL